MVGVPGRSKACATCRKRRKGCDGKRPACTQCRTAGLECAGYTRPTIFVNWTEGNTPAAYTRQARVDDGGNEGAAKNKPITTTGRLRRNEDAGRLPSGYDGAMLPLSHGFTRSAYVEQYISLFCAQYYPHGRLSSATTNSKSGNEGYFVVATSLYTSQPVIEKVILAFSMCTVGKQKRDIAMIQNGVRAYTIVLHGMAKLISSGVETDCNLALILTKFLNGFEMAFGEDFSDLLAQSRKFISHLEGEVAITEAKGPEAFQEGESHEMFVVGRQYLIVSVFKTRRRFFLHNSQWMTVPWHIIPKRPRDRITDIILEAAGLFEDLDLVNEAINENIENAAVLRSDLLNTCWRIDARLDQWLQYDSPTVQFYNADGILRNEFNADEYALADLMHSYWSACLMLYSILEQLVDPYEQLPTRADPGLYLRHIARTIPMVFRDGSGLIAKQRGISPLTIALYYLYTRPSTKPDIWKTYNELLTRRDVRDSLGPFIDSFIMELKAGGFKSQIPTPRYDHVTQMPALEQEAILGQGLHPGRA